MFKFFEKLTIIGGLMAVASLMLMPFTKTLPGILDFYIYWFTAFGFLLVFVGGSGMIFTSRPKE